MMAEITIAGQKFTLDRIKPAQIAGVSRILSSLNIEAKKELVKAGIEGDDRAVFLTMLGHLTADRLVEFAALLIGSDKKFAEEHWDLMWISKAWAGLLEETDLGAVIENFMQPVFQGQSSPENVSTLEEDTDTPTNISLANLDGGETNEEKTP